VFDMIEVCPDVMYRAQTIVCPGQTMVWISSGWGCRPGLQDMRGDEYPAELADHVLVAGMSLGGIPAGSVAAVGHEAGRVPGQVVPDDHQALNHKPEGHGAFHGAADAVAGFPDTGDLLGVSEGTSMAHRAV
jgi:hypothetical protein